MYKILKNKNGKFDLIEIATELKIDEYVDHASAKKVYNRFKGGQCFAGWTPAFFMVKFKEVTT